MRRAIIATAGTIVGLVVLLDYKSSGALKSSHLAVTAPAANTPASTAVAPTTSVAGATGPTATSTPPTTALSTPQRFTGEDVGYRYGDVQIEVTLSGGRLTSIAIPQESATDGRSQSINSQAIPILTQEALAAQGVNIDVVSGATYTSDAFARALQSALAKGGK